MRYDTSRNYKGEHKAKKAYWIEPSLYEECRVAAEDMGTSMSELIRVMMIEFAHGAAGEQPTEGEVPDITTAQLAAWYRRTFLSPSKIAG